MKLKSAIIPILVGVCAYGLFLAISEVSSSDFNSFREISFLGIPILQFAMYTAVAAGLYLNVSEINTSELLKNRAAILSVLLIGVPTKILIPGFVLFQLSPLELGATLLCATVIAQIDPILTARNVDPQRFSKKSGTILRCWSSFDDPITVLFAFYIFLPLFFETSSGSIGSYLLNLCIEILVCGGIALFFRKLPHSIANIRFRKLGVITTCLVSALLGKFLLPAALGLATRPFRNEKTKTTILNWIFWFSAAVIGALVVDLDINWQAGFILGTATFAIAQPLVSFLFIRGDSPPNFLRIVFGHQNGMTAILLTIAIELETGQQQLMSVTIPAVLFIALFYTLCNSWLDRRWPPDAPSEIDKELKAILNDTQSTVHQITNALTAISDQKKHLQARYLQLNTEITALQNGANQALKKNREDRARQLLDQKHRTSKLAINLKHELASCQQLSDIVLQELSKLKECLLEIKNQIVKRKQSVSEDGFNQRIQATFNKTYSLFLATEKLAQKRPVDSALMTVSIQANSKLCTVAENNALDRPSNVCIPDITAGVADLQMRLRQYKASNKYSFATDS